MTRTEATSWKAASGGLVTVTTPMDALERLRAMARGTALAAFCEEHHIDLLVVFGSVLEPGGAPPQDLDVAVLFGREPDGPWGTGAIVADLMAALRFSEVDLLDLSRAGIVARTNALGLGEPLYERHPGMFAREQMRALGQRMEHGWLTDLALQTMAQK